MPGIESRRSGSCVPRTVPNDARAVNARGAVARSAARTRTIELGLRLEQVDAAVDEVDDVLQLRLLLDLLRDEPLEELVAAMIVVRLVDGRLVSNWPATVRSDSSARLAAAATTRSGSRSP